ncbi:MBL fold metallo-hydrolase [Rugosimonospora africana]|uniref:Putative hydrolase (Beta-lactamase-like) n=1 Tax=Rugosimonospora africana TaxID=556532 RepID=A0A8J3QXZ9_9ACTN|nr:MBL fold metallo-hydrolase [Rugosimonospora africana]GIH18202.1 putative hydrolase (beta-lactamase-like) [Rugosimonospora africana]
MAGEPVVGVADQLPSWATLVRAPNPGPMTLAGTNTWVLRPAGVSSCVVVDPGPLDEGHLRTLADQGPVAGILLTHGHHDHTDGVDRLIELTGAVVMNESPGVQRIVTPGHTGDSVCFLVELDGERAVLTGDTILGRGTTVVAYPDGDLGDYLRSLELLEGLGPIPVLPGHGPPLPDCAAVARHYLEHRKVRLDQVRRALDAGATTAGEVVEIVYADVDRSLWTAAEWSVRAQLAYLAAESPDAHVRWDTS